jgi:hypothetical protein
MEFEKEDWIHDLPEKGVHIYSQVCQDGRLDYIFENVGTTNKICVEFGFNTDVLTGGSGANTANLILNKGWTGVLFDRDFENHSINLYKETLTCENISEVFKRYAIPPIFDYLSIDVDSIDLWLMKAVLSGGFRPRVMTVEYNSGFDIGTSLTLKKQGSLVGGAGYGASLLALVRAAAEFNYSLVCVESGLDLFFVDNALLADCNIPDISSFESHTKICYHGGFTQEILAEFVEYPVVDE